MRYIDLTNPEDSEPTYNNGQKIAGTIVGFIGVVIACYAILDAIAAVKM